MNNYIYTFSFVGLGSLLIGLYMLNFSNLAFNDNQNAYILIIASFVLFLTGIVLSYKKPNLKMKNRKLILNLLLLLILLDAVLEIVLNITELSNQARCTKVISLIMFTVFIFLIKNRLNKHLEEKSDVSASSAE